MFAVSKLFVSIPKEIVSIAKWNYLLLCPDSNRSLAM